MQWCGGIWNKIIGLISPWLCRQFFSGGCIFSACVISTGFEDNKNISTSSSFSIETSLSGAFYNCLHSLSNCVSSGFMSELRYVYCSVRMLSAGPAFLLLFVNPLLVVQESHCLRRSSTKTLLDSTIIQLILKLVQKTFASWVHHPPQSAAFSLPRDHSVPHCLLCS